MLYSYSGVDRRKNMYRCAFVNEMIDDGYFSSYIKAKKHIEELGEWCMLISPKGVHISAFIDGEWITLH